MLEMRSRLRNSALIETKRNKAFPAWNTLRTYNIYEGNMFAASLTEDTHVYMLREQ
jgi:hypothetical protein